MKHSSITLDCETLNQTSRRLARNGSMWLAALFLAACGGGGGTESATPPATDTIPNAFSFIDQLDVVPGASIDSDAVVIGGINAAAPISVSDGEYAIDGGPFTSAGGTIDNGQSVVVRLTASPQLLTTVDAALTVGGVSDTFSVTTLDDTTAPQANIQFPPARSRTESDTITVHGVASDDYSDVTLVEVNGVVANSSDGFATWSVELPLDPGNNTLDVRTIDTNGNSNAAAAQANVVKEVLFGNPNAVVLAPNLNRALVLDRDRNALISVDLTTGERYVLSDSTTPNADNPFVDPTAIALRIGSNRALVVDDGRDALLGVDLVTGERTLISDNVTPNADFPLFGPVALTIGFNPSRALVVDPLSDAVLSVDLATGQRSLFSENSVPNTDNPFVRPVAIALDAANDRALVVDHALGVIIAVDRQSGERTVFSEHSARFPFSDPTGIVVDQANNRALVTDAEREVVIAIDLTTGDRGHLSENLPGDTIRFRSPAALVLDAADDRALVLDSGARALLSVDLSSGERDFLADNSTPNRANGFTSVSAIAIDGSGNRALLASRSTTTSAAILSMDLATGERSILSNEAVPDSNNVLVVPTGITVDGGNNRALVVDAGMTTVLSVDLANGSRTVFSSNTTPNADNPMLFPRAIALDASNDRALLVDGPGNAIPVNPMAGNGSVLALDLADGSRSVFSSNTTHNGDPFDRPGAIAIDGASGRALVTDSAVSTLFGVDLATGDRAVLSNPATPPSANTIDLPAGVAVDAENNRAFVVDEGLEAVIAVDLASGSRNVISDRSIPNSDNPLSFDVSGRSGFSGFPAIAFDTDNNRILVAGSFGIYAVSPVDGQRVILSR